MKTATLVTESDTANSQGLPQPGACRWLGTRPQEQYNSGVANPRGSARGDAGKNTSSIAEPQKVTKRLR